MDKTKKKQRIIALIVFMAALLIIAAVISAIATYKTSRANESLSDVDTYSMHEFSEENCAKIMKALASGKSENLAKAMISSEGAEAVTGFADWKNADFENAVSMGSGSLVKKPDKKGNMEINERFFVDIGGKKYVLFIETSTSRWGRVNDGVSAVGVTTYEHFDELDYAWNGEADDDSALAGKLLWNE